VLKSPQQEYFLKIYAQDLITNKPDIFLDAVGGHSFIFRSAKKRHENFPIINAIIEKDYKLSEEVEGMRIYVRQNDPVK
jgi:hypothetical protein